jgi:hypothetical protein
MRSLALVIGLGCIVYLPAITSKFILDDYMHAAMIDGTHGIKRGPFEIYDFVNDGERRAFIERGLLPWWSHPQLKVRFFRPLPSAMRWLEQTYVGQHVLLMHLHSLLWWLAAVLAVHRLLGRILEKRPAMLATAIFALGPWHVLPLAWLANREALVSITFGVLAIDHHLSWRKGGSVGHALAAAGLFGLALLGGEYALCLGGYVLAMELVRRGASLPRRLFALMPFVLPSLIYLGVRAWLGYGTYRSGFYTDPLREPLEFLKLVPERAMTLLTEGWLTLGTSAWGSNAPAWVKAALVASCGTVMVVVLRKLFESLDGERKETAGWLLWGSLIAMIPVLAVVPAPRVLGLPSIGMAAIIALLVEQAWFRREQPAPHRWTWFAATILAFLHLVHGPIASVIAGQELRVSSLRFAETAQALAAKLKDPARAEIIVARGQAGMFFGPFAIAPDGAPPARWRNLSHTNHALALRKDAYTLELRASAERGIFPAGPGNLFRSPHQPFKNGDIVDLPGLKIEIVDAGTSGPRIVRYTFERPLEEEPLVWLQEGFAGFRDITPPAPGFGLPLDP